RSGAGDVGAGRAPDQRAGSRPPGENRPQLAGTGRGIACFFCGAAGAVSRTVRGCPRPCSPAGRVGVRGCTAMSVGLAFDLQYFAEEKTEKATPRRRQEARRKGQVAKSAEL